MIHQKAKQLAEKQGFYIFPIKANEKIPLHFGWQKQATTDPKKLDKIWFEPTLELYQPYNIGIFTGKFEDGALLVIDVDNKEGKNGKNGSKSLTDLKAAGFKLPKTMAQTTPTGGLHLIYKVKTAVPNSVQKIGPGLDVRSKGGYILGEGSIIDGKPYVSDFVAIADAPQWLIEKANEKKADVRKNKEPDKKISQKAAKLRGQTYLLESAPIATEGEGGDQTTFMVANRLKDMGLSKANALQLMFDNWNDNCQPPWDAKDLKAKVKNAYAYGQNSIGADSPENDFTKVPMDTDEKEDDKLGPVEKLNEEYSFVVLGGRSTILKQTGAGEVIYMNPQAFHDLLAAKTIQTGNGKRRQLSEQWFNSHKRNTFSSVQLIPGKQAPPDVYNLWRGFRCKPLEKDEKATDEMKKGVAMFKEHALINICANDKDLFHWLFGYFAHLIQKPWEKPLTALVFKGKKGVGKNALIDRIGNLFNGHYLLTSNKRYLTSNFNKHLANLILFVLDEAFWSGDKQAEGILKDLITGHTHLIEHKGREMFSAKNVLRVCIIGNEDWVVPTSEDERRFAIFNVGDERQKDRKFFTEMKKLIDKKGGNRLLLTELSAFDLASFDINDAPITDGLLDQKIESLNSLHSWWFASLKDEAILNLDFNDNWPTEIDRDQLRLAYSQYARERGIKSWLPDAAAFGRDLLKCCFGLGSHRLRSGENRRRVYSIPDLSTARAQFDEFIGHKVSWDQDEPQNVIDMFK